MIIKIFIFVIISTSAFADNKKFGCFELQAGNTNAAILFFENNLKENCVIDKPISMTQPKKAGDMNENLLVCCHLTKEGNDRVHNRKVRALLRE